MRPTGTEIIVDQRRYTIERVIRSSSVEGWASYLVRDIRTGLWFRVSEYTETRPNLEKARQKAERAAKLKLYGLPMIYGIELSAAAFP